MRTPATNQTKRTRRHAVPTQKGNNPSPLLGMNADCRRKLKSRQQMQQQQRQLQQQQQQQQRTSADTEGK